ncbi:MAG: IS5 family transposase [Candidatus Nitrosotenuis sp.]
MYQWKEYNERLVRRGEILISKDVMESWNKELAVMNRNKIGRKYQFPDSFMKILGYVKVYFGLGYRQTEGLIRTYHDIPAIPDHTIIHKRINKLKIQLNSKPVSNVELVVDSSGIKVTNRGEWMVRKWQKHRKGFLKIHVGVDVSTKQILAVKVTDEHSHDSKHLKYLLRESTRYGTITKLLGDGAYDSREIFSYIDRMGAVPAIRVRKNAIPNAKGCYIRKTAVISQKADYSRWAASVSYGKRWIVESVFSSIKRMFGEEVRSKKRRNMIQELMLKISLYNWFVTV